MTEQGRNQQEGQPKSLFDVLVTTTVSEFVNRDSFLEVSGNKTGYTLWFACSDAIKEALKTGRTSLEIFTELINKGDIKPTDINNLAVVGDLTPKTWDEYLNITSELILEKLVAGFFPDLALDSEIRFNRYA